MTRRVRTGDSKSCRPRSVQRLSAGRAAVNTQRHTPGRCSRTGTDGYGHSAIRVVCNCRCVNTGRVRSLVHLQTPATAAGSEIALCGIGSRQGVSPRVRTADREGCRPVSVQRLAGGGPAVYAQRHIPGRRSAARAYRHGHRSICVVGDRVCADGGGGRRLTSQSDGVRNSVGIR